MNVAAVAGLACAVALAGCASFDGRGLVPGQSRLAEVEATMGVPAERVKLSGGDTALYYPKLPFGRRTYVATVTPDGTLRSLEQRLQRAYFSKVAPGAAGAQVRELLGPPARVVRMPLQQRDVWEYPWLDGEEIRVVWVQFGYDGAVREVYERHDFDNDPPSLGD